MEKKIINTPEKIYVGTHNSGAYNLNLKVNLWDTFSLWNSIRLLGMIPPFRGILKNATLCQHLNIYEQLKANCTVFDFRILYAPQERRDRVRYRGRWIKYSGFYLGHSFCCDRLESHIDQIKKYYNEMIGKRTDIHGEIVGGNNIYIFIKPDYPHRENMKQSEAQLIKLLNVALRNYSHKINIFYQPHYNNIFSGFNPPNNFIKNVNLYNLKGIWVNTSNMDEFEKKVKNMIENGKVKDSFMYYCITPDIKKSLSNFKLIYLVDISKKVNPTYSKFLVSSDDSDAHIPKFILFDHVDKEFVDKCYSYFLDTKKI
jgi:hypothetical protein